MFTDEKRQEVKKKLTQGYPQGELINDLLEQGYSSKEIQDTLYTLSTNRQKGNKSTTIPLWYAASIGSIILGIAILSVKYLWIYYYGYVFLILGLVGLIVELFMIAAKKKE
jgi:hypothetical protein